MNQQAKSLFKSCYEKYSILGQDEGDYGLKWGKQNISDIRPEFTYKTAKVLQGYPYLGVLEMYSGGGYVIELRGSTKDMFAKIKMAKENNWIDFRTRAVFVEFTVYNPSISMFGMVTALMEYPGTGGVVVSYRIEPTKMQTFLSSDLKAFELLTQVLFALGLVGYMVKEIRNIIKMKLSYFTDIWSYCELFIICGSFGAMAAFAGLVIAMKKITKEFERTFGNGYSKFQKVSYWSEYLGYLISFITFAATLKFIRVLRFNPRIGLLGSVMRYAARGFKYLFCSFLIVFTGFVLVFYLLYMDTLSDYNNIINAMETNLQILLGKFDFTAMYERDLILGPLLFGAFSIFIVFIMISMFIAILEESFAKVKSDIEMRKNESEMVPFMIARFLMWTRLNNTSWGQNIINSGQVGASANSAMNRIYKQENSRAMEEKIAGLNETMDQFLAYIQRTHISQHNKVPFEKALSENNDKKDTKLIDENE